MKRPLLPFYLQESIAVVGLMVFIVSLSILGAAFFGPPLPP